MSQHEVMEKLAGLMLVFPVLMAVLFYQYRRELIQLAKSKLINDDSSYDLLIVIPSARDHFLQRQTIRDTWWKAVSQNDTLMDRVKLRFILGVRDCGMPLEDRLDEYGCDVWIPDVIPQGEIHAVTFTSSSEPMSMHQRYYGQQHVTFRVLHPVLLTKLGLHRKSVVDGAKVALLDAVTQKEIVSVQFSSDSKNTVDIIDEFIYKHVDTYLLPKGFEGVIIGDDPSTSSGHLPYIHVGDRLLQLLNSSVIQFSTYEGPVDTHYDNVYKWKATSIPVVSFMYMVNDAKGLGDIIDTCDTRRRQWEMKLREIDSRINSEQEQHQDIMIVDVLDIYRNIPDKLLWTFQSVIEQERFQYLLKTDDDCFLNVEAILKELSDLRDDGYTSHVWWGRFRHNWAVEVHGKWAERTYMSPVYPRFACGAGYVISRDIVAWLAENMDHLQTYQGEDVSMGIWLSAINPVYVDDPLWQCESECISNMYATPELNHLELQKMWTSLAECGDSCGCG